MIKEDYVSFEIAKLLKEKGFPFPSTNFEDWLCCMYDENGDIKWGCYHPDWYVRVTHQMAMKWLREIHHLHINVGFGNDYKGEFLYMGDIYDLTNDAIHAKYKPIIEADDYLSDNPKTYEEAVEAAIKYSLENLI